jgi:hypothetical protein
MLQILLYLAGLFIAVLTPLIAAVFVVQDVPVPVVRTADAKAVPQAARPLEKPTLDLNKPSIWIAPTREYKHLSATPLVAPAKAAMAMEHHQSTSPPVRDRKQRKEKPSAAKAQSPGPGVKPSVPGAAAAEQAMAAAPEATGSHVRDTPALARD